MSNWIVTDTIITYIKNGKVQLNEMVFYPKNKFIKNVDIISSITKIIYDKDIYNENIFSYKLEHDKINCNFKFISLNEEYIKECEISYVIIGRVY